MFVLDAPRLPRRHRGRRKRQTLPPGAGPSLLPAHHRIERAEAAPAASDTSSRAFGPRAFGPSPCAASLCASATERRSQAGTAVAGPVEAVPSSVP